MLELYRSAALEAWYALFKHGDPAKFYKLMNAAPGA
jgi:hypothetical protein